MMSILKFLWVIRRPNCECAYGGRWPGGRSSNWQCCDQDIMFDSLSDRLPFRASQIASAYDAVPKLPVTVLLDNVRSAYNVGSFFRTADAVALDLLLLTGITGAPPAPGIRKTALGAEETVRWEHSWEPAPLLDRLHGHGCQIAAIET